MPNPLKIKKTNKDFIFSLNRNVKVAHLNVSINRF